MRVAEWLLLLIAAIVLPLTFQAIFARRRDGVRPSSRHSEHFLTARLADHRKPGPQDRQAHPTRPGVHAEDPPLHERGPSA